MAGGENNKVVKIYSNSFSFAALKENKSVVTWGAADYGGDSSGVDLTNVVKIYSNNWAFAALKSDGSVVTWGRTDYGGDSSGVDLTNVVKIYSTESAFAALKSDGSVVTWGNADYGGDSSGVKDSNGNVNTGALTNDVVKIYSNVYTFAALKSDGSVVTWGNADYGGDWLDSTSGVKDSNGAIDENALAGGENNKVVKIYSNSFSFAALKGDGSVVTWGYSNNGGDWLDSTYGVKYSDGNVNTGALTALTDNPVVKIYAAYYAYAALKIDGSVVTWGNPIFGGNPFNPTYGVKDSNGAIDENALAGGVVKIYSTGFSFAALKGDGSVVTWGYNDYGGNSTLVVNDLTIGAFNDNNVDFTNIISTDLYNKLIESEADNYIHNFVDPFTDYSLSSSASGDPYITTLSGKLYKLPNIRRIYRCLETTLNNRKIIINAEVSQVNVYDDTLLQMMKTIKDNITEKVLDNGYYFSKFYISVDDEYVIYDHHINVLESNFDMTNPRNMSIRYNNNLDVNSYESQSIAYMSSINISIFDRLKIQLQKINHPQIINGIGIKYDGSIDNIKGIFKDTVHPKQYSIRKIDSKCEINVKTKKTYNKIINDKWIDYNQVY